MSENIVINKRLVYLTIMVVGLLLIGTNMPPINIPSFDISSLGGSPKIPEIALNPPDENDRQNLTDRLIKEKGYEKEEIGKMRAEVGNYILPTGDEEYLFDIDNIPKIIPISESVVIENLEIIEGEWFEFELRNVGLQEAEIPFFILNTVIIVEDKKGNLHRLDARRLAWIEVSENNILAPGEKKEIISENPFKILKEREERDGIICVEIESVWIEFQSAKDIQFLLRMK